MLRSYNEFVRRVSSLLDVELEYPVNPYDSLYDDWGLDSLQAFQLIIIIESLAGLDIPPDEIPLIYTVQDAFDYYRTIQMRST